MKYLSPIDAAFLRMESKRTPMHVGAMMTFRLPADAPPDFVRKLMTQMRDAPFMPPPFGYRLARGRLARVAPAWEQAEVDMDYHLRHSALPFPGGERELGQLVARLHSHPLDMSRPLWECHLIEGLENRRFALYFKAHHCAIDGMGAMRMVQKWLSADASDMRGMGPWVLAAKPERTADEKDDSMMGRLRRPAKAAAEQARGLKELVKGLSKMSKGEDSGARMALSTPRSLFNVAVSQQRRLGTQILDLNRIKAVAAAAGASVNDTLLAVIGGAVRRYLVEHHALPEKSLLASVPVGLSRPDGSAGNAVAGFVVPLGTDTTDGRARLELIQRVTARSKAELSEMPPAALAQFALLGLSPLMIGQITGVLPKLPPFFNFVVSNVVLSKHPLYLMGAELEAMYPVSFLFDGYALNITLVGYMDRVAVGFLGCREVIPHLQRLAVYTTEALTELEREILPEQPKAAKPKRRKLG
ncbi:MAG TPA: wax ester/triacylglycerol synthase family O-acyltransferase [Solimonas sp.]|nr:wax ester/triacylglycerol synthase family O-acyltransferase [Solimonas sp.]